MVTQVSAASQDGFSSPPAAPERKGPASLPRRPCDAGVFIGQLFDTATFSSQGALMLE